MPRGLAGGANADAGADGITPHSDDWGSTKRRASTFSLFHTYKSIPESLFFRIGSHRKAQEQKVKIVQKARKMVALGPPSLHPTLTVTLPTAFTEGVPSSCYPYVLVVLPPSLYLDPWKYALDDQITKGVYWLAAQMPANVELEKPMLWGSQNQAGHESDGDGHQAHPHHPRLRLVAGKRYIADEDESVTNQAAPDSKSAKIRANRHRDYEAILLPMRTKRSSGNSEKQGAASDAQAVLKLPLHARYQNPLPAASQRSAIQHFLINVPLLGWTAGNYVPTKVPRIEAFWVCDAWPIGSFEKGFGSQWEKVQRPSTLLPASHIQLTSALLTHLPDAAAKRDALIFRRTDVLAASVNPDLMLRLPTGDASFAASTFTITQTVMWILALSIAFRVHRLTK